MNTVSISMLSIFIVLFILVALDIFSLNSVSAITFHDDLSSLNENNKDRISLESPYGNDYTNYDYENNHLIPEDQDYYYSDNNNHTYDNPTVFENENLNIYEESNMLVSEDDYLTLESDKEHFDNLQKTIRDDHSYNHYNDKVFNIAVVGDWGCSDDAKKTVENIQSKDPELVIAAGDLSYKDTSECWLEIIEPLKSRMIIAMGDHEYSETKGGDYGLFYEYLKPFNLEKTYYSFNKNNVHIAVIDPYIDYKPGSAQYDFIEQDLRNAASNPKIDWTFVVESIPIYTASSEHEADSAIRDFYHPLFDKYGVDLVFSSDNHNYQRTFPLKYNNVYDMSEDPIITYISQNNNYNSDDEGVVYLIIGTGGRSLYEVKEDAPFVASYYDKQFGFLNIDVYSDNALQGTFYANENYSNDDDDENAHHFVSNTITSNDNNVIDRFMISNTKHQEQYSS